MKKLNNQGFTLIELLAVITIMGILMMVAIPAVSRTIDNSRKDTFKNNVQQYANEALTKWAADQIYCGSDNKIASALGEGLYVIPFSTEKGIADADLFGANKKMMQVGSVTSSKAFANASSLVTNGGKSSWGNQDVYGYVFIIVKTDNSGASSGSTLATKAYVTMRDGANHGIKFSDVKDTESSGLRRSNVLTSGVTADTLIAANTLMGSDKGKTGALSGSTYADVTSGTNIFMGCIVE